MPRTSEQRQSDLLRQRELERHLELLFGATSGHVYVFRGEAGHFSNTGSYQFRHREQAFFAWPQERAELVQALVQLGRSQDVYFAPRLRSQRSARGEHALPGSWLYVDKDTDLTGPQAALLTRLMRGEHYLVSSGSSGRFHLYLRLSETLAVDALTDLNYRLAKALGGEKWEPSALLRPAGTFNHKSAARGARPQPVRGRAGGDTPLVASELGELLPSGHAPRPEHEVAVASEAPSLTDGLPLHIEKLMQEEPRTKGRSEQFFHLVMSLNEAGYGIGDINAAAASHRPSVDKWPDLRRLEERVAALLAAHPHPGRPCVAAACPNQTKGAWTSSNVGAEVARIRAAAMATVWPLRKGNAMREVVLAACTFAEVMNTLQFFLSEREFALLARVSRNTFRERLPDLVGWIELVEVGTGTDSTTWRLLPREPGPQVPTAPAYIDVSVCGPTWGARADAFRYGGLGGTAKRIFFGPLATGKHTAKEHASALAISDNAARNNLNKLAEHRLATRGDDGRWAVVPVTQEEWSSIAASVGKLGAGERQEQRILLDRKVRVDIHKLRAWEAKQRAQAYRQKGLRGFAAYHDVVAGIEQRAYKRATSSVGAVGGVVQVGVRTTVVGRIARMSE